MCEANCVLLITSVLVERDWIMIFERLSSVCLRQKHFFQGIWSLGGKGEGSLCLWRTDPRALIMCYVLYSICLIFSKRTDMSTYILSKLKFVHSLQRFSNFQTTCRVLGILLYIALFPTVSHYSMKLQSVCTRSPGLPLPTRAGSSFMVQRTKLLIGDMLQKRPQNAGRHSLPFPHTYCNTIHFRLDLRSYWLWIIRQTR